MSEETTQAVEPKVETTEVQETTAPVENKTFNQDQLNNIVQQRLEAEKRKHENQLAEIKKQEEEALKEKGVIKIITWQDIKNLSIKNMHTGFLVKNRDGKQMTDTPRHILAKNYVRYVGDPVLAIIAEKLSIAESAAEKIQIEAKEIKGPNIYHETGIMKDG